MWIGHLPNFTINPIHTAPLLFLRLGISKIFPETFDETLCKFLFCTYENSHNLILSKKLSRGHVVDIYVAWVENCKNNNFKFFLQRCPFYTYSFV